VLRHLPYTGGRVVLFEQLRDRARRWHGLDVQPQCVLPLPSSLAIGLAAGALGQTMAVPADLIKVHSMACLLTQQRPAAASRPCSAHRPTSASPAALPRQVRMQADGRRVAAGQLAAPRYRGVLHALRSIVAEQGGAGLWRGSAPAIQRAALVNLGELTTYDQVCLILGTSQPGRARHVRPGVPYTRD
jgi:solute carrier family 25 uncoupling protein 27